MYISDIIGSEFINWTGDSHYFIDSGPNSGKTFFVTETLGLWAESQNKKVLYLSPRELINRQVRQRKKNSVDVRSLQHMMVSNDINLDDYDYVVVDEVHWLIYGGECRDRDSCLEALINYRGVVIYMTGTPGGTDRMLERIYRSQDRHFETITGAMMDYDHIDKVYYTTSHAETVAAVINESKIGKVLYLTSEIKKAAAELSVAIGSQFVKKITAADKEDVKPDSDGYSFPDGISVVVATSVLNSGIEYKDSGITAVVVEMPTPVDVTQGIYRRRPTGDSDKVTIIVRNYTACEMRRIYGPAINDYHRAESILTGQTTPQELRLPPSWAFEASRGPNSAVRQIGNTLALSQCQGERVRQMTDLLKRAESPEWRYINEIEPVPVTFAAHYQIAKTNKKKFEPALYYDGKIVNLQDVAAQLGTAYKQREKINKLLMPYGLRIERQQKGTGKAKRYVNVMHTV